MTVRTANARSEAEIVDTIGSLKAEIAPLEKKLKELEAELKVRGAGKYEGDLYDATIFTQEREKLDMDAVRAKLSAQFLRAHTEAYQVTVLKVSAKKFKLAA